MAERGVDPDSYLTEIDRRLEAIQGELRPGQARPKEPPARRGRSGPLLGILRRAERPEPAEQLVSPASAVLVAQIRAVSELQARLIVAIEELLDVCESQLGASPSPETPSATSNELTVSAGPFSGTEALRVFERALADLPGVRQVDVRGYEGVDQAVFVIELDRESPPDATP